MRISLPTSFYYWQWHLIDPQKQTSNTAARPRRILTDFPIAPVGKTQSNAMDGDCKRRARNFVRWV
jgi:hypothetical protein